ncbi:MAG: CDP-alcohol phosphatidyltransferase family protein [Chloroherpetonaceae bacterium]|nr:CDP-alcohol phosphatidyltransferase family protein [Chloroherpetonaceae bacterium]MDW8019816.1 CDP-alcohol phosphatidyltransferase family protein [Chloroherpetonaceae bacterium]MDW8467044.1 CDP-alcohol phosphatidyltransferase family protein [Chloroherpetonaceae bacterium]
MQSTSTHQAQERIFTLSNFLSVLRILLVPPFIYFFSNGDKLTAFVLMLVAISTDWFDGRVARWTNSVSEMGKILDPLADKLSAALIGMYFAYLGELPLWFVVFLFLRDAIIFGGGIYAKRRKHILTTALPAGKWAVGFVALLYAMIVFPYPTIDFSLAKTVCIWIATGLLFASFVQYAIRFRDILQGKEVINL